MMKVLIGLLLVALLVSCGDNGAHDNQRLDTENQVQLEPTYRDYTDSFNLLYDVAAQFESAFYGAFGMNYHRIDLLFDTIYKTSSGKYSVEGETVFNKKVTQIKGSLRFTDAQLSDLNLYNKIDANKRLALHGVYELKELNGDRGVFYGTLKVDAHIVDESAIVFIDEEWMGDEYENQIFDGFWSRQGEEERPCYFGDGFLSVGDLNRGKGEFIPKKKYVLNGWWDYVDPHYLNDSIIMMAYRNYEKGVRDDK